MRTFAIAVDLDEKRAEFFTAYVATWSQQRQGTAFSTPTFLGAYGILLAGRGRSSQHWGAGYAMSDDALRAFAIERLLSLLPEESGIVVYTRGLVDHIRFPDGHVRSARTRPGNRKSSGEPYDAFAQLDAITAAMDQGRWSLRQVQKRDEPDGFRRAQLIAMTSGRDAAERNQPMFLHLVDLQPRNFIVATDEQPDPYGLISCVA